MTSASLIAIIDVDGHQHTVSVGDVIDVQHLDHEVGTTFDTPALLISDAEGKETRVGMPTVEGAKVTCKVLDQFKGEKVHVFRMKSKKHYDRTRNFRPHVTQLEIIAIA